MFIEYGKLSTIVYNHTKKVRTSLDGDLEFYSNILKNTKGKILEAGVGKETEYSNFICYCK